MQRAQVCLLFLGGRPCATAESCGIESFAGTLTVVTVAAIEIGGVMEVAQMAADALRVARRCFGCGGEQPGERSVVHPMRIHSDL